MYGAEKLPQPARPASYGIEGTRKGVGSLFQDPSAADGGHARSSPPRFLPAPLPLIAPHTAIDPAHVNT